MPRCSGCKRFVFKTYDGECADCTVAHLKMMLEKSNKQLKEIIKEKSTLFRQLKEKQEQAAYYETELQKLQNEFNSVKEVEQEKRKNLEEWLCGERELARQASYNLHSASNTNRVHYIDEPYFQNAESDTGSVYIKQEEAEIEDRLNKIENKKEKSKLVSKEGFVLSDEQADAVQKMMNSNDNFFVTGKAGTGKSVVLRYFISHTDKHVAVVAPTGIAAINVKGQTIHKFFGLSPRVPIQDVEDPGMCQVAAKKKELLRSCDVIVIDEISMVRSDVMDMIDHKLKIARDDNRPFGGCQIIAFGDLYQLPPIDANNEEISELLHSRYPSSIFFFGAPVVEKYPFTRIELKEVHRQKDPTLISVLNEIRLGNADYRYLKEINECARKKPPADCITITTTNGQVDAINKKQLDSISGETYTYDAVVTGRFDENEKPAPTQLRLKVGAFVMLLQNNAPHWVNGSTGIVTELSDSKIVVTINGATHSVDRSTWSNYEYSYNKKEKKIEQVEIGSFNQFPIKLAYAMTVHKSQGQTYDKILIDFSGKRAFAPGQTYVALSRCRSMEGLYLKDEMRAEDIKVSQEIVDYMNEW